MRLIDDVRRAWRLLSVQIPSIGLTACAVWLSMPEAQRADVLAVLGISPAWLALATFAASIVGRVVKQESPK
jgi:hypothetical protein